METLYLVQVLKKLEAMMHAVNQTTTVHYDIESLELIAVLKKHERV